MCGDETEMEHESLHLLSEDRNRVNGICNVAGRTGDKQSDVCTGAGSGSKAVFLKVILCPTYHIMSTMLFKINSHHIIQECPVLHIIKTHLLEIVQLNNFTMLCPT